MRNFVCKLRLYFPDSQHLLGLVCHEIFGNFFHHLEIFSLHPPTIHASYGPGSLVVIHSHLWSLVCTFRQDPPGNARELGKNARELGKNARELGKNA